MSDVVVYANGLVRCSVCAPRSLTPQEVEQATNAVNPTGIDSGWRISDAAAFADGTSNPAACHDADRTHYLMEC